MKKSTTTSLPREVPIPFAHDLVKAILDGKKTVTRRTGAPRWKAGDTLWVREPYAKAATAVASNGFIYRATDYEWRTPARWLPGMLMPRTACRLFLVALDVFTQRLGDMTNHDAGAEGMRDMAQFRAVWNRLNTKRGYPWVPDLMVFVTWFTVLPRGTRGV